MMASIYLDDSSPEPDLRSDSAFWARFFTAGQYLKSITTIEKQALGSESLSTALLDK